MYSFWSPDTARDNSVERHERTAVVNLVSRQLRGMQGTVYAS